VRDTFPIILCLLARLPSKANKEYFMRILFINNDGGGFADYIDVPPGANVEWLFAERLRGAKPENYLIRVNRQPAARDQVLAEGDRVSMTPTKIEGATPPLCPVS
jgi:hypothetical protein